MKMNSTIFSVLAGLLLLSAVKVNAQDEDQYNDAEIADIAVTANQIDIKYAELAKQKSENEQVLAFANTMIKDHEAVINQAVELVTELGVEPESNALSEDLQKGADETLKMLTSKSGEAFDLVYIENEVAYHQAVIDAVENILIPQSDNEQLKKLLQNVLPALKAHLAHAEKVRDNLESNK